MKSLNIPYNPRLDQLRWLAATIVFLFHFHMEYRGLAGGGLTSPWWGIVTEGHTGVGLFFTLSGFLFMQIALHQKVIVYRDFVRNRFLRIFPLFLVVFMLATSISRDTFEPADVLYLLATNLGLSPTSDTVITGAAWTISLEFTFYLMFPFIARFAMERGMSYLGGLMVLMLFFKVAAFTVNEKSTLMYFSTFVGRFDQFLIGMVAALAFARCREGLAKAAPVLVPAALLLAVANSAWQARFAPFIASSHSELWIVWPMIESAVWALVIVSWVSFDKRLPHWLDRALVHGGKISFSFYLLHMAVLHVLVQRVGLVQLTGSALGDAGIMFAGAYGATWALSALSYNVIEEPFLRMRRAYGAVSQGTVPEGERPPKLVKTR
ncbi:MAG TPA: acyltransferase [Telluria sp.]|nr:acyltransferase [Telluria sp.]